MRKSLVEYRRTELRSLRGVGTSWWRNRRRGRGTVKAGIKGVAGRRRAARAKEILCLWLVVSQCQSSMLPRMSSAGQIGAWPQKRYWILCPYSVQQGETKYNHPRQGSEAKLKASSVALEPREWPPLWRVRVNSLPQVGLLPSLGYLSTLYCHGNRKSTNTRYQKSAALLSELRTEQSIMHVFQSSSVSNELAHRPGSAGFVA